MAAGVDNLLKIDEGIRDVDKSVQENDQHNTSDKQYKRGELQFEAYMRMLDSRVSYLTLV